MNETITNNRPPLPPSASPLARTVRAQRLDYELTVQHAANLSGLSVEQWEELEEGTWIPDCCEETDAVARGIGANATTISFLALISQVGRWKYLN